MTNNKEIRYWGEYEVPDTVGYIWIISLIMAFIIGIFTGVQL